MANDDDFQTTEQEQLGSQFSVQPDQTPGFWSGFGERGPLGAIGSGIDQGLLYGASDIVHNNNTWSPPAETPSNLSARAREVLGLTDQEKETDFERTLRGTADQLIPDPRVAGAAYRTLQSVSEFGTELALGRVAGPVGAMATVSGITRYERYHDYRDQGVDPDTAEKLSNTDAAVAGVFAAAGGIGGSMFKTESTAAKLMTEVAAGVGTNVPLGIANRYLDHKYLADAGYDDLAAQQQPWDGIAMLTDVGMGLLPAAALGLHTALAGPARAALSEPGLARDAASIVKHREAITDLAPGIPLDGDAARFHETALRTAVEQDLTGRKVNVSEADLLPESAEFLRRPTEDTSPMIQAFAEHLDSSGLADELGGLDDDTRALVERFTGKLPAPVERAAPANDLDRAIAGGESPHEPVHVEPPAEIAKPAVTAEELEQEAEAAKAAQAEKGKATSTDDLPLERDVDMTRKAPQWRPGDETKDSMLEYMVRHPKGIDSKEAAAQGIDPKDMNLKAARIGMRRAFRKGGLSFDEAAEHLFEAGYPVDDEKGNYSPNVLLDRISDELAGRKVFSLRNETEFKRLEDEHYENERQRAEAEAEAMLAAEPERAALDKEFTALWRDEKDPGLRRMASKAWDEAKTVDERRALIDEIKEMQSEKRNASREADRTGVEDRPDLTLQSENAAELKERGERERQEADAQQLAIRIAGERERADRERDQFSLTGSDRMSDWYPNQMDLVRAAMEERPFTEVPDAQGRLVDAAPALEQAQLLVDQANAEADKAFKAATDCFDRGGP